MSMYRCPCGHEFHLNLGAYGCPNCLGESGRAEIAADQPPKEFFFRVVRMTRKQLEEKFPQEDTDASQK